jgi:hypothetical protein
MGLSIEKCLKISLKSQFLYVHMHVDLQNIKRKNLFSSKIFNTTVAESGPVRQEAELLVKSKPEPQSFLLPVSLPMQYCIYMYGTVLPM